MTRGGTSENSEMSRRVIERVLELRELYGLSVQGLAERVTRVGYPVSARAISLHETRPNVRLALDYVFAVATALRVAPESLWGEGRRCGQCGGEPPAGFTCNACGERAS